MFESDELVSVIVCIRNSEQWIQECLESITTQTYSGSIEISVFDDGSSDKSIKLLTDWYDQIRNCSKPTTPIINNLVLSSNPDKDSPRGVGYAKNRAIEQSSGKYLCFLDSDDVMHPERIASQLEVCRNNADSIVGAKVCRVPADSTPRYINWANNLSPFELQLQIYTCFGPTILMPTWFCARGTYDKVGNFDQSEPKGVPEDLIFFYDHLKLCGKVIRVDKILLTYRYHKNATTFSISDEAIWKVRLAELEKNVLIKWNKFSIWNAGKEGRRLYRLLSENNRKKVIAFADVDLKKIAKKWYTFECCDKAPKPKVPIIHYTDLKPPVVICVKLGLSNGNFEQNLASLNLREGIDFVHFG